VFTSGADPVKIGLVSNFSRPGTNITGISLFTAVLASKRLELWLEVLPQGRKIALLVNRESPTAQGQLTEIQELARGVTQDIFGVSTVPEIMNAFASLRAAGADALFVTSDPFFFSQRTLIIQLAARHSIPAIYEGREFVEAGGLMSYGTNIRDGYREAGVYTGRILKGENPADMPVQQPTKTELLINLKTAKGLGLTLPPSILARADEVIE
jgi:putative ABC transport system substrate-binding protein